MSISTISIARTTSDEELLRVREMFPHLYAAGERFLSGENGPGTRAWGEQIQQALVKLNRWTEPQKSNPEIERITDAICLAEQAAALLAQELPR